MYHMRILLDIVRQSLATLWAHKLRSFLTMFGIAWGVGSLLLLVGLGEGFRSGQEKNMAELGEDIMFIFPGRIPAVVGSYQSGQPYYFTYADISRSATSRDFFARFLQCWNAMTFAPSAITVPRTGRFLAWCPLTTRFALCPLTLAAGLMMRTLPASPCGRGGWELLKNMFPGQPPWAARSCSMTWTSKWWVSFPRSGKRAITYQHPSLSCSTPSHAFPTQGAERGECHLLHQLPAHKERTAPRGHA